MVGSFKLKQKNMLNCGIDYIFLKTILKLLGGKNNELKEGFIEMS